MLVGTNFLVLLEEHNFSNCESTPSNLLLIGSSQSALFSERKVNLNGGRVQEKMFWFVNPNAGFVC